ncbi:MAG: DUF3472 domain-containing protein [Prolixibacteraceae bacterium]
MRSTTMICLMLIQMHSFAGNQINAMESSMVAIPAGGNSFLVSRNAAQEGEKQLWQSEDDLKLYFFRTDKDCAMDLYINLAIPDGKSRIMVTIGKKSFKLDLSGKEMQRVRIGKVKVVKGYVRVEFRGISKAGPVFAELADLEVQCESPGVTLAYVKDNIENRFYWGRRGPSVHLNYELPGGVESEYFYNEVNVPIGEDPEGSYFMANGFGEGYFGIQVNGPQERRILFSVWSPFKTDHPGEIPETDKIKLLAKGEGVYTGEFGNEGSGGQSYYRYPWVAGTTYRFLLKGTPDRKGSTVYKAWFYAPEVAKWKLIASFSRPKTDHYLTRFHSFLENFNDENGYLGRKALYSNQWCRDKSGKWFRLTKARFTADDIARRGYRMDYAGGTEGNCFFLRNGGFFNENTEINSILELKPAEASPPEIDFKGIENSTM